jgi:hypothetical protein
MTPCAPTAALGWCLLPFVCHFLYQLPSRAGALQAMLSMQRRTQHIPLLSVLSDAARILSQLLKMRIMTSLFIPMPSCPPAFP